MVEPGIDFHQVRNNPPDDTHGNQRGSHDRHCPRKALINMTLFMTLTLNFPFYDLVNNNKHIPSIGNFRPTGAFFGE